MTESRRGRPPALTEAQIVKAALLLTRRGSFETLSMRELAYELGVGAMTIYNYVPNKAALHELVAATLLGSVDVAPAEAGSWDRRLFRLLSDVRVALRRYPTLHVTGTAAGARLAEGARSILAEAGLRPADARLAHGALWALMAGRLDVGEDVVEFAFDAIVDELKRRPAQPVTLRQPAGRGRRGRRGPASLRA